MAELLLEVGVMFAAIALVGALATRFNQSVIPFYVLSGMALSPFVIGRAGFPFVTESEFVSIGAELGIVFLLFFLGLEFNIDRLIENRERIGKVGVIDLVINFTVGFLIGFVIFRAILPAILVAGIVYISSSAIISKSLIDLGWIANEESNPMLGTLVFEDLVIAVYLAVVSAIVLGADDLEEAAFSVTGGFVFIFLLLVVVYFGTVAFERVLATSSNEFITLRTIGVTVLIAGAGLALGVSEAVAAFFIGMAFSGTGHVQTLETLLEPIRDTFAAVFFFWIGLVTDPMLFVDVIEIILLAVVITAPSKMVSGFWGGRVYGLDPRRSTRVGVGMVTRGEFSLIIATLALAGAGLTMTESTANTIYAFSVGYVLLMSILGTTLMQHSGRIEDVIVERVAG